MGIPGEATTGEFATAVTTATVPALPAFSVAAAGTVAPSSTAGRRRVLRTLRPLAGAAAAQPQRRMGGDEGVEIELRDAACALIAAADEEQHGHLQQAGGLEHEQVALEQLARAQAGLVLRIVAVAVDAGLVDQQIRPAAGDDLDALAQRLQIAAEALLAHAHRKRPGARAAVAAEARAEDRHGVEIVQPRREFLGAVAAVFVAVEHGDAPLRHRVSAQKPEPRA